MRRGDKGIRGEQEEKKRQVHTKGWRRDEWRREGREEEKRRGAEERRGLRRVNWKRGNRESIFQLLHTVCFCWPVYYAHLHTSAEACFLRVRY